jgi:glutamate-1-semialdehyde 2,1-aminomutase
LRLGVNPDIAVFGKSLANGHPMAAIIGTPAAMDGANGSFISSTFWTESLGPVAALATLEKMARIDLAAHCRHIGTRVQAAWRENAQRHGLPVQVDDTFPALAHFAFKHEQVDVLKTLYVQLMLDRGFLARDSIYVTLAHTDAIIDKYVAAIDEVFGTLAQMLAKGDLAQNLKGPVAHGGFRRLL